MSSIGSDEADTERQTARVRLSTTYPCSELAEAELSPSNVICVSVKVFHLAYIYIIVYMFRNWKH